MASRCLTCGNCKCVKVVDGGRVFDKCPACRDAKGVPLVGRHWNPACALCQQHFNYGRFCLFFFIGLRLSLPLDTRHI